MRARVSAEYTNANKQVYLHIIIQRIMYINIYNRCVQVYTYDIRRIQACVWTGQTYGFRLFGHLFVHINVPRYNTGANTREPTTNNRSYLTRVRYKYAYDAADSTQATACSTRIFLRTVLDKVTTTIHVLVNIVFILRIILRSYIRHTTCSELNSFIQQLYTCIFNTFI